MYWNKRLLSRSWPTVSFYATRQNIFERVNDNRSTNQRNFLAFVSLITKLSFFQDIRAKLDLEWACYLWNEQSYTLVGAPVPSQFPLPYRIITVGRPEVCAIGKQSSWVLLVTPCFIFRTPKPPWMKIIDISNVSGRYNERNGFFFITV
jgi:hypothetical protein